MIRGRPVQAYCRLCERLFCYFQVKKPRVRCPACAEIERKVENAWRRDRRAADRRAA